jgi:hypothetical protein
MTIANDLNTLNSKKWINSRNSEAMAIMLKKKRQTFLLFYSQIEMKETKRESGKPSRYGFFGGGECPCEREKVGMGTTDAKFLRTSILREPK